MTKAWDGQDLIQRMKSKLAPIAGVLAGDVVDWASESLKMNSNNYVRMFGGVVAEMKQPIIAEINKHIPATIGGQAKVASSAPAEGGSEGQARASKNPTPSKKRGRPRKKRRSNIPPSTRPKPWRPTTTRPGRSWINPRTCRKPRGRKSPWPSTPARSRTATSRSWK